MDRTLKLVFFWASFLIGFFFIWWSDRALNASSAMVAFATGAIFLIVACVVALTSDIFFKYDTQEDTSSVPASRQVFLLPYDKITRDSIVLNHQDVINRESTLLSILPDSKTSLDDFFTKADLDVARLDAVISSWQEIPVPSTRKVL